MIQKFANCTARDGEVPAFLLRLPNGIFGYTITDVHDRMPVVLPKARVDAWLSDCGAAEDILHTVPPWLERRAVSAQRGKRARTVIAVRALLIRFNQLPSG